MTNDKLEMVKTLIYLSQIDDQFSQKEKSWVIQISKKFSFRKEIEIMINQEMINSSGNYANSFRKIESFLNRSKVLDLSRHLFQLDGVYGEEEKAAYHHLQKLHKELSPELSKLQKEAAKDALHKSNDQAFYKELTDFNNILTQNVSIINKGSRSYEFYRMVLRSKTKLKWIGFAFITIYVAIRMMRNS